MLAVRRTDVGELNLRARAHMAAAGWLSRETVTVPVSPYAERSFAAGDLVVARRNDYTHGLINGERGVVTAVDAARQELTVRFGHRLAHAPAHYLRDGGLDHGYALTIHQAQGLTCDRALLLGSDALYREAGYVALSRGRLRNDVHLVDRTGRDEPTREDCRAPERGDVEDALDAVRVALARSRAQSLAVDLRP